MQTNNNNLTEIGAIVLSCLLVLAAALLMYFGKVDFTAATVMFTLAGAIFAGNLALKAPSPTQQAALLQLTAQALQTQAQPVGQVPLAELKLQSGQTVQAPAPPQGGSVIAPVPFAPAMLTTREMPTVPPPQ
jgi:hypothetical protein